MNFSLPLVKFYINIYIKKYIYIDHFLSFFFLCLVCVCVGRGRREGGGGEGGGKGGGDLGPILTRGGPVAASSCSSAPNVLTVNRSYTSRLSPFSSSSSSSSSYFI